MTGRRPWWWLKSQPEEADEDAGEHEPGDGRVQVPTRYEYGELAGWVWCTPEDAPAWDCRLWRNTP